MKLFCRLSVVLMALVGMLSITIPVWAYPCFYEKNAPTRQGGGGTLLAGVVDAGSGAFVKKFQCLTVQGPIALQGTIIYRTQDSSSGPFGVGSSCAYDWFIQTSTAWPGSPYVLITPGNKHYVFDVTPVGGNYVDTRDPTMLGASLSFTGQPTGVWCTVTWKDQIKFRFDTSGGLISIVDRFSNTITITRNQVNGFTAMVYLNGNTNRMIQFLQDTGNHRVTKIRAQYSFAGTVRSWTLGYDVPWSKLVSLIDPLNKSYSFTYTSYTRTDGVFLNLLATIVDPRLMTPISAHYDASGRISSLDSPLGGSHTFAYSTALGTDGTTTGTDPDGHATAFTYAWNPYHHSYNLTQIRDNSLAETTTIERNAAPSYLPTAITDYRSRRCTCVWNNTTGDLLSMSHPTTSGGTATYTFAYNPTYHIRTSMTDPTSRVYAWNVDPAGKVTTYTNPAGEVTSFSYDAQGQILTVTDPMSHTTTWTRDVYGLPVTLKDPANHTTTITRYDTGLVSQVTDATNLLTTYTYDAMDRCLTASRYLSGSPLTTTYVVDALGNKTQETDAAGHIWKWDVDCVGNVIKETSPLNLVRTWAWSPTNRLLNYVDFASNRIEASYLTDGRMSVVNFRRSDGSLESSATYTYDPTSHLLASCNDTAIGTTSYQRDLLDQLTSYTSPNGSMTYQYDLLGRETQLAVAGQNAVTYAYNTRGNVSSTTQSGQTISFNYDSVGRLVGQVFPNGVVTEREYGVSGLVDMVCSAKAGVVFDQTSYTRDNAGAVTSIVANGVTKTVGYDTMKRVTSFADAGNTWSWAYNNVGLKTQQIHNGSTVNLGYNAANQLTSYNALPVVRNNNGQPTSYNGATYSWDVRGRMTGYTVTGSSFAFAYDHEGHLLRSTNNGTVTNWVLDHNRPVKETTGASVIDIWRGPTLGGPLKRNGNYYSTDGSGSTTKLTDSLGNVVQTYTYAPYGTPTGQGSAPTPFQFRGAVSVHPNLASIGRIDFSTEWGQPLGGVGLMPTHPMLPNNPTTAVLPSPKIWALEEGNPDDGGGSTTIGDKDEDEHRKADSSGCMGSGCDVFAGPPGSGAAEAVAKTVAAPVSAVIAGVKVAFGVFNQAPEFCKQGAVNLQQFAKLTGSKLDPFYAYGMANMDPADRLPCIIKGAETINFNLDGFDMQRAINAPPDFAEGNYTNAEFQMCQQPTIAPKVSYWECMKMVPAPSVPYGPNYEGAADPHGTTSPYPGEATGDGR